MAIRAIKCGQSWVSFNQSELTFPFVLKPRQKKMIEVSVDALDAEEEYAIATIEVESTAGSEKVSIEVLPPPDLEIDTGEYEIYLDGLNLEDTYATITAQEWRSYGEANNCRAGGMGQDRTCRQGVASHRVRFARPKSPGNAPHHG